MGTNHINKITPYCYGLLRNTKYHITNVDLFCWGDSTDSKKLFTRQKGTIRYITKVNRDSCKPSFKSLNITQISMRILECALFVRENNDQFIKKKRDEKE